MQQECGSVDEGVRMVCWNHTHVQGVHPGGVISVSLAPWGAHWGALGHLITFLVVSCHLEWGSERQQVEELCHLSPHSEGLELICDILEPTSSHLLPALPKPHRHSHVFPVPFLPPASFRGCCEMLAAWLLRFLIA